MVKLQLRLDQRQTSLIIESLAESLRGSMQDQERLERTQLRAWLTWRKEKLWGAPGNSQATPVQELPHCRMCDTRHVTANESCAICGSVAHCAIRHRSDHIPPIQVPINP